MGAGLRSTRLGLCRAPSRHGRLSRRPAPAPARAAPAGDDERVEEVYDAAGVLAAASLVGVLGGGGVVLFSRATDLVSETLSVLPVPVPLVPAAGGVLCVAALKAQSAGLPRALARAAAAAATLGTGNSLGPEGPSVELGSAAARAVAGALGDERVGERRRLSLLAAGSAAGVSAGFGASIAGAFFAVETVLQPASASGRPADAPSLTVAVVLLSSVLAGVVTRIGIGAPPIFEVPPYELRSLAELPLYLPLGVLCGCTSALFLRASDASHEAVDAVAERVPREVLPLAAGLVVGVLALAYPQVLYASFENLDAVLEEQATTAFSVALLAQLVGVKLFATALCRASGLVGGLYGPSLFMGASLGSAYGRAVGMLPEDMVAVAPPQAYALVAMAAMLGGNCGVPLTAVLLMFELTEDYRIIGPILLCVGVSQAVSAALGPSAAGRLAGAAPAAREQAGAGDGKATQDARVEEAMRELPVSAAMRTSYLTVHVSSPLADAGGAMVAARERIALVVDDAGCLRGVLTLEGVRDAMRLASPPRTALQCATERTRRAVATSDMSLAAALQTLTARGLRELPVVAPCSDLCDASVQGVPIGILEQDGVELAATLEATRQALAQSAP